MVCHLHDTGVFTATVAPSTVASLGLSSGTLTQPHCAKPSMTSSILVLLLQLRLHIHQWPLLASPSTKFQRLPMTPSKPVPPRKLLDIAKFDCQHEVQPWLPPEESFCVLILRNVPRRFCLSDVSLTVFSSVPTKQYQLSQ